MVVHGRRDAIAITRLDCGQRVAVGGDNPGRVFLLGVVVLKVQPQLLHDQVLEVKEHSFFERRGADLYCTIPVSIAQAALGAELSVPGLNGEEKLKIPEGTQGGAVFRIKGHGLQDPRGGGKGDLYYHVRVITPSKLNRDQRKLMEQLGVTLKVDNKPAERGSSFFDKVKDIFG